MASELRVNTSTNRVGLGTITYTDTGPIISGITTGNNFKTGTTNVHSTGVELVNINTAGATATFGGDLSIPDTIVHTGDTNTKIRFPAADTIQLETGGSNRLKIDANGVVQVTRRLELTNSGDNHAVYEGRAWTWTSNGTTSGTVRAYMYGDSSSNLRIGTNGWNERVRITSDGNVHINSSGLSSPYSASFRHLSINNNLILNAQNSAGGFAGMQNNAYLNSSGNWVRVNNDHATSIGTDDGVFYFRNAGAGTGNISWTHRLTILADGKIGIGDNSPDRELVVKNASSNSAIKIEASNAHTSQLFFSDTDAENVARISVFHGSGQATSNAMLFGTAGSTRLMIAPDGEVFIGEGFGATNRSTLLSISGANQDPTGVWSQIGVYSSDSQAANKGGSIGFGGQDGSTPKQQFAAIKGAKENGTSGNYAGYMAFYVRPAGAVSQERLRITSAGNILINNTNGGAEAINMVGGGGGILISRAASGTPNDGQTLADIGLNSYSSGNTCSSADVLIRGQADGNHSGSSAGSALLLFTKPSSTGPGSAPTERLRITKDGHVIPGADNTYDLGSSSKRWKDLYVGDAHFSNRGSSNEVDGTWGDWTLQEGESKIFMINNRTGKKYSLVMEEE